MDPLPSTPLLSTPSSSSSAIGKTKSLLTARIFGVPNPVSTSSIAAVTVPLSNTNVNNNAVGGTVTNPMIFPAPPCTRINTVRTNPRSVPSGTVGTSTALLCQEISIPTPLSTTDFPQNSIEDSDYNKFCRIQGCNEPICNDTDTSILLPASDSITNASTPRKPYTYCIKHNVTPRLCEHSAEPCTKRAQGNTRFCIAHGGGRRCTYPGCDRGARDKFFCAGHGGGKRCFVPNCGKSAVGGSNMCTGHGGGKRCDHQSGCTKSAQAGTRFCVKHGGGRKCVVQGCEKVARGRTSHCAAHGGGVRCRMDGCNRVAIGRRQLCRAHGQQQQQEVPQYDQKQPSVPAMVTSQPSAPTINATLTSPSINTLPLPDGAVAVPDMVMSAVAIDGMTSTTTACALL